MVEGGPDGRAPIDTSSLCNENENENLYQQSTLSRPPCRPATFESSIIMSSSSCQKDRRRAKRARAGTMKKATVLLSILASAPAVIAESCISLSGSTQCSAFNTSSISTTPTLVGLFPFLSSVTDTASFDTQLAAYVSTSYVQLKYQQLLGCGGIDLTNTSNLYARFTTSVLCNAVIQNSISNCALSTANSLPLCAQNCVEQAQSEKQITEDSALCSNPSANADAQIRADYTVCALPATAIDGGTCIQGIANEPTNCGFGPSTFGLCAYCGAGGPNSTDTCCYSSQAESKCAGVVLPTLVPTLSLGMPSSTSTSATSSPTSSPTSSSAPPSAADNKNGLSGGAIAGIVVGSIVGVALIAALIFLCLFCLRKRRREGSIKGSVFNQPSPPRRGQGTGMAYNPVGAPTPAGFEVLPGGRIARMSALEGHSGDSPPRGGAIAGGAAAGAAAGYASRQRHNGDQSSSDEYGDSPVDQTGNILRPPPTGRRHGSLSSSSALGGDDLSSPVSGSGHMSSPMGLASQQSEQLPFFKDYYSSDEIHPGDKVATLWAYQPRAGDEFALERGDMLKVVGIWDDGWATGVLVDEKADEWDEARNTQRDSGVSNGGGRRDSSPPASDEIKAFPLVCVCLPEHWRKTIEGDGSTDTGASSGGGPNLPINF